MGKVEDEVGNGDAFADGDLFRQGLGELRVEGLNGVVTVSECTVDFIGTFSVGDSGVDAFMHDNPSAHPAMDITLKAVNSRDIKDADVFVSVRSLRKVGEVFATAAGAKFVTCDSDVVEGQVAVVKTNRLTGLDGQCMRNKLTMSLIDERRGGWEIVGALAALHGDDHICERTICGDFPRAVDDVAMAGAEGIATDIDFLRELGRISTFERDVPFDAGFFSDLNSRSKGCRDWLGYFTASSAGDEQNDSKGSPRCLAGDGLLYTVHHGFRIQLLRSGCGGSGSRAGGDVTWNVFLSKRLQISLGPLSGAFFFVADFLDHFLGDHRGFITP